jgi:hypothetical protein
MSEIEMVAGSLPERAGIPCPQCGAFIEIRIEDLLRRTFFRCRQCGLELTLNRAQTADALESVKALEGSIEDPDALGEHDEDVPLAMEEENPDQVGAPDPALRTSPMVRAGETNADYNCWYNGKQYSNGALICQVGEVFQCSYGYWVDQGRSCGSSE